MLVQALFNEIHTPVITAYQLQVTLSERHNTGYSRFHYSITLPPGRLYSLQEVRFISIEDQPCEEPNLLQEALCSDG